MLEWTFQQVEATASLQTLSQGYDLRSGESLHHGQVTLNGVNVALYSDFEHPERVRTIDFVTAAAIQKIGNEFFVHFQQSGDLSSSDDVWYLPESI